MAEHAENLPITYVLTSADRCDGCGARAYARVTINIAKSDIDLCYHHFRKHEAKLREIALDLLDETDSVNVKLDVSP